MNKKTDVGRDFGSPFCYRDMGTDTYWELVDDIGSKLLPWSWRWQVWIEITIDRYSRFQKHQGKPLQRQMSTGLFARLLSYVSAHLRQLWVGPPHLDLSSGRVWIVGEPCGNASNGDRKECGLPEQQSQLEATSTIEASTGVSVVQVQIEIEVRQAK